LAALSPAHGGAASAITARAKPGKGAQSIKGAQQIKKQQNNNLIWS
jgi:hypothetical protein